MVLVEMDGICAGALQCSYPTPAPGTHATTSHTGARAATDWAPTHCCLPASSLFLVLDRKNQMVMDGMDNRVRSAIMPLCLAFSGREERTWLWPLGLGGSACAGGRWCRRPSPSLLCAMAPPRVSSLDDGNVHGSASTKGRGRE